MQKGRFDAFLLADDRHRNHGNQVLKSVISNKSVKTDTKFIKHYQFNISMYIYFCNQIIVLTHSCWQTTATVTTATKF